MNVLNGQVVAPFSQWQGVAIILATILVASIIRRMTAMWSPGERAGRSAPARLD